MVYFLCKAYDSDRQNCYFALSLPVRGAWIEIGMVKYFTIYLESLPVRGAWIEITMQLLGIFKNGCRSPCGERGLKLCSPIITEIGAKSLPVRGAWIEIDYPTDKASINSVAPRAGSVD